MDAVEILKKQEIWIFSAQKIQSSCLLHSAISGYGISMFLARIEVVWSY